MKRSLVIVLALGAAAAVLPVGVPAAGAAAPLMIDVGVDLTARDINARGVVVGESNRRRSSFFRWKDGRLVLFGDLGVNASRPVAINRDGVMAIWTSYDTSIRYDAGAVTDLGSLSIPASETLAADINDQGTIVGSSVATDEWHAFVWKRGAIRNLGTLGGLRSFAEAVNDTGQIVGTSETANGQTHVVIWQDGRTRDLGNLKHRSAFPADINDKGQIVGTTESSSGQYRAFVWTEGTLVSLPPLPGDASSSATAINEKGEIVGVSSSPDGVQRAVLWVRGKAQALAGLGGAFIEAVAINDDGTIAGNAQDTNGDYHAVVWTR